MKNNSKKFKFGKKGVLILIFILIIIVLMLCLKSRKNDSISNLVLRCYSEEESNEYIKMSKVVSVYEKDNDILYNDEIEVIKLTNNIERNELIDAYFKLKIYGDFQEYARFEENGNKIKIILDVNLSVLDETRLESLFKTTEISVDQIKSFNEEGGLTCEKY